MSSSENTASAKVEVAEAMLSGIATQADHGDVRAWREAAILAFGRRANARPPLSILMQDAVTLVAEVLEADLGGVGEVVAGGTTLILKVAPAEAQGAMVNPVVHKSSLAAKDSLAGCALNSASPVVTSNLPTEKRFTDLFLRGLDVISAVTVPLYLNNEPFGTLGVYRTKEREFTPDDVRFAEIIAHLLASAAGRVKAEEELQRQRALAYTVLDTIDSLVVVLDAETNLVSMNRACQWTTGFSIEEVRGELFCNVFVVPEEIELFNGIFRSAVSDKSPREFEGYLLTKDGIHRNTFWSLKVICNQHRAIQSLVLIGADRSGQLDIQREPQPTEAVADEAYRAIQELRAMTRERISSEGDRGTRQPLQPVGGKADKERRSSSRERFQYRQSIAPIYGKVLPSPKKFFEVTCENISAGGISFYLNNAPDFEDLVVALGNHPTVTYFAARVVRATAEVLDGRRVCLVGCRFTGRVHL